MRYTVPPFVPRRLWKSLVIVLLATAPVGAAQRAPAIADEHAPEAAWERMIEAKGGRPLLRSIGSVLLEEHGRTLLRLKNVYEADRVYVFPGRAWQWVYELNDESVEVVNADLRQCWFLWRDSREGRAVTSAPELPIILREIENFQIAVLLETEFVQPRPIRYSVVREGMSKRGLLEAQWKDVPIRYYVDFRTMLPVRVSLLFKKYTLEYWFSHYARVDGILVPQRAKYGAGPYYPMNWKLTFNVKYREDIFERPPRPDDTRDAWRKRPE